MNTLTAKPRWDIFCRVIDNYGDIGVCWRLARQLSEEYSFDVRLWVDEVQALVAIWPTATLASHQLVNGVTVVHWSEEFNDQNPADVIIEAFACNLPETYIVAMKQQPSSPRWFNLDYLSAENWVEGFHGLDSIHPQYGLKKKFYFPGFTSKTGGLLREKSLFSERDIFQRDIEMRNAFLAKLGVKSLDSSLTISLFGYENNAISSLLDSFVEHEQSILCLVPAGRILPNINAYIGETLSAGDMFTKGALTLKVIPFLTQTDYDRLLWLCDINFVRGEDSFVRAQWAAKPFVWHIYPQEDGVHMEKLNAFLELYLKKADLGLSEEILRLWRNWNQEENVADAWKLCVKNYQTWLNHSQSWPNYLESLGDLAENIVRDSQKIM